MRSKGKISTRLYVWLYALAALAVLLREDDGGWRVRNLSDVVVKNWTTKMKDLSYRSAKTEVRESPIHGKGLFAKQAIAAGEVVAVKGGQILTQQEWATLEPQLGSAEIQISEELFIAPTREEQREGCMLYANHSCDPNIAIQGQIVFVAMRDIVPNEELTHDWATTDDLDYDMACNCGSPDCRGAITGKDWMKRELQEKYKGWFCWFIQRKIDALSPNDRH